MIKELTGDALKNHSAILGKAGSGKTYAAKGIVESLLDRGERVCVVDPTGVWWGLKSNANGKSGAYPVVIFGGEHADVPLGAVHGESIAEIVATSNTPAIVDTSLMKVGERTRFFTDFASELLRKNKGPLHLFIDEAHVFAPQGKVPDPQAGQMLHATNNLVSLGRARGLRVTMITQRPAKLHKDSLTQVETMIAMRLIAPQDRNAVEDWIADQADEQKGREIIASLPSLTTGIGWVWSPEIGVLSKVKFPKIKTFDSSSTPVDFADGKNSPVMAPIDLPTISGRLATIKEEAAANDPVRLKARILELEKRVVAANVPHPGEKAGHRAHAEGYAAGYSKAVDDCETAFICWQATMAAKLSNEVGKAKVRWPKAASCKPHALPSRPAHAAGSVSMSSTISRPNVASADDNVGLRPAEQRVVDALGFWLSIGNAAPTRAQVAAVSGYSVKSSGYEKIISQLGTKGHIVRPAPGALALGDPANANTLSPDEARTRFLSILGPAQRRILDAFTEEASTRENIAARSNYSHTSSGFEKTLSQLSSIGVIVRPAPGMVDLSSWVRELL